MVACAVLPHERKPEQKISDATPFRLIGDIPFARFEEILRNGNSPFAGEARACYTACLGHTAFALAQSAKETEYGRTARSGTNNAFNIMPNGSQVASYPSWADSFASFAERCRDVYARSGVYTPAEMSLRQMLTVFIGGPGCLSSNGATCANGETRDSIDLAVRQAVDRVNTYLSGSAVNPATPNPPATTVKIGAVPRPQNFSERLLPQNINTAWDDLGRRIPRGIVLHRMLGSLDGTDAFFRSTAPYPNGAARNARTDFGVGAGKVYQWTPLNSNIAPWASGPANGVEGDGIAFVNRYGINAINRDCASVEVAGQYADPVTGQDWQRLVEVVAWIADSWLKLRHDQFPKNADGLHCVLWHDEFANKPCPGDWIKTNTERLILDARALMRRYQTGA